MRVPLIRVEVVAAAAEAVAIGNPGSGEAMLALVRALYAIGRTDLPLGRLAEGHVDALQIVRRYGTAAQAERARAAALGERLFGVWNADRPGDPTRLDGEVLFGGKAFASGAGLVTDALISVDALGGRQLLLIDLAAATPSIDRGWWQVTGMQRSETHVVGWHGQHLPPEARVGAPGDYVREPWFSGGAIRFAAVQAGGVASVVDGVRDHLVATGRDEDPLQRVRLAALYAAAQSAADAVRQAAAGWSTTDISGTLARVAHARVSVCRAGEEVLRLAAAAIGVQAMFVEHPLAGTLRDLDVYLRQPAPDAQRLLVGRAVADGVLVPLL